MAYIFILQNLLSLLLLTKYRKIYKFISLLAFFIIFIFKENTFDLISYERMFNLNNYINYEFIFVKFIDLIRLITTEGRVIILTYQFTLIGLAMYLTFFFKNDRLLIFAVIISSVAFMLATHNNLRQGMSSIMILISIISFYERKNKLALIFLCASMGFHRATIYFISIMVFLKIVFETNNFLNYKYKNNKLTIYILALVTSIFCYYGIIGVIQYISLSGYEGKILSITSNRWNLLPKAFLILLSSVVVEIFLKFSKIDVKIDSFRFFKLCLAIILFLLSLNGFYDELGSRILFYYFIVELGLIIYLTDYKLYNTLVLILLSYVFAFNVINILGGI